MKKKSNHYAGNGPYRVSSHMYTCSQQPGTGPVIVGGGSDGSSHDIGEKVDQIKGGTSAGSTVTSSGQGNNAVGIAVGQTAGEHAVETNSRGRQ